MISQKQRNYKNNPNFLSSILFLKLIGIFARGTGKNDFIIKVENYSGN